MRKPVSVDRAFLINLPHRADRLQRVLDHVHQDLGWTLPIHRFDAVDTRHWSTDPQAHNSFTPYVRPEHMQSIISGGRTAHGQLQRGAVGCYLSHLRLWCELLAHADWEYMLIFEDDVVWSYPQKMTFEAMLTKLNEIPNDWDLLFLGGVKSYVQAVYPNYAQMRGLQCMHAYIIHRSAVPKLITHALPMREQIDHMISTHVYLHGLKVYTVEPNYFWQTWADSDVQTAPLTHTDVPFTDDPGMQHWLVHGTRPPPLP